jgi:hypothetical protein
MHTGSSLAVEAVPGTGKMAQRSLAELAEGERPEGWWNGSTDEAAQEPEEAEEAKAPAATADVPLRVSPNPFNPRTAVSFYLGTPGMVRLRVFDIRGRHVRALLEEPRGAGSHRVVWNGEDDRARQVASGVYFVVLEHGDTRHQQRIALLR